MIKKRFIFLGFLVVTTLLFVSLSSFEPKRVSGFHLEENEIVKYHVPHEYEIEKNQEEELPATLKSFSSFAKKMAYRESRGMIHLVNPYGYMGKYQFGKSTLRAIGIQDFETYLKNESLQDKSFKALLARNKWELQREIALYSGRVINSIEITESGLLAAAHLGGASSVKRFLNSNGKQGFKDGFGTSVSSYIKKFAGYDVSMISANANAVVH